MTQLRGDVPAARSTDDKPLRWTPTGEQLRNEFRGMGPVVAGEVIAVLLRRHLDYVDEHVRNDLLASQGLTTLGPRRLAEEHLNVAAQAWDPSRAPVITGRHFILGLALDADVGWLLLRSGIIGSLLSRWRPGAGSADEPYRLVWDILTASGRERVEEQPLLAAAFGAPAEWSVLTVDSARAIAWSPTGDRLAILAANSVYEARPGQQPQLLNGVGESAVSIGWGSDGVVVLTIADGTATLSRAADGSPLGDWSGVTAGLLSGDGSHAWLVRSDGVHRWSPTESPTSVTLPEEAEPGSPLALDRSGRYGLLGSRQTSILVNALSDDAASVAEPSHARRPPCALVTVGGDLGVAAAESGEIQVDLLPRTPVCRIAVGAGEVTALATDATGTRLAVALGNELSVWALSRRAASARAVPGYDSDLAAGTDLLDADRDAQAIAALVASAELRPPLSIGLFGAWGSGKSFILDRVKRILKAPEKPAGYLRHIRVVEFNAWHYAEANLWASLVDQVLVEIAPVASPISPPEVSDATARASQARAVAKEAAQRVTAAEGSLHTATKALVNRRRRAAWLAATVLALLAAAIVVAILGGPGVLVAGVSAVAALIGSAAGALQSARQARDDASELATTGRAGMSTVSRLLGRTEALAVEAQQMELRKLREDRQAADDEARRLDTELSRLTTLAATQPLGTLLHRLSTITDYRDQLSLVTRTRTHLGHVDDAIRESRKAQQAELERIVVIIDDLDRCPPEKVVTVLEAVHLLFSFEMFVVLIAVDTRWLEQSLRMRYRQLLGRKGTAAPTDYLEKIIQVPLHLRPLSDGMIRQMIAGLAGTSAADMQPPSTAPATDSDGADEDSRPPSTGPLVATTPRTPRKPLAAELLKISQGEGTAMGAVAPLIGTTPRTVKRFVNTYRLLKARAPNADGFDEVRDGLGDHEVVAFLLAVVTGQPAAAAWLLPKLRSAPAGLTVQAALIDLDDSAAALAEVRAWLSRNNRYATAPAQRYAEWVDEVGRFTFVPSENR